MKVDTTDIPIDVSFTKLANLKKKKNEIMKRYDWQIWSVLLSMYTLICYHCEAKYFKANKRAKYLTKYSWIGTQ